MAARRPTKPKPEEEKALATTSNAIATKTSMADILAEDAGAGLETMSQSDFAIPRLTILQQLSPQVNKRDEAYVKGAEAGMIFDNVSNRLWDGQKGFLAVLVSYRRSHLQWWPRDTKKGKGFIKDWGADPSILDQTNRNDKGQNMLADGSEIVPTGEYFLFAITDPKAGTVERAVVSMAKTQLIKARRLNTMVSSLMVKVGGQSRPAPLFYRAYWFKTKPESNEHGNWFGWDITPGPFLLPNDNGGEVLPNGEQMYMEARAFRQAISANQVQVRPPVEYEGGGGTRGTQSDDAPM